MPRFTAETGELRRPVKIVSLSFLAAQRPQFYRFGFFIARIAVHKTLVDFDAAER
jgi:hypothetical protein